MRTFFTTLLIFTISLAVASWVEEVAYAQSLPVSMSMVFSPQHPKPNALLSIELTSMSVDVSHSTITWYVNGAKTAEGVGLRKVSIKTGAAGEPIVLRADATMGGGVVISETQTIRPAYVALAWEAQTYTPPLYGGKALVTPGARITFTALPIIIDDNGKEIPPSDLYFSWQQGGREIQDVSGAGRFTYIYENTTTFTRPITLSVKVETFDRKLVASTIKTIPVVSPELRVYQAHPLLGMRYNAPVLASSVIASEEATFVAEPYFISSRVRTDAPLEYIWNVNGGEVARGSTITLRPVETGNGNATIELRFRHLYSLLQAARKTFAVTFDRASIPQRAPAGEAPPTF